VTEYALDGKTSRKKNNALALEFVDSSGPVATAVQSADDGRKTRMSILMGWRNGGPGRHVVSFADGRKHIVEVGSHGAPTRVLGADDQPLGTITAGSPSEYRSADGSTVLHIEADGEPSPATVPMLIRRPDGEVAARMLDIRTNTEWKVRDSLRAASDMFMLVTASGAGSVPIRRFGTQTSSETLLSSTEVDALVAISVAICIGMADLVPQLKPAKRGR
jgi:nitroreductase